MKYIFNELAAKPQVKNCTNDIISIKIDVENSLMKQNMGIINEIIKEFANKGGMTLLIISTN